MQARWSKEKSKLGDDLICEVRPELELGNRFGVAVDLEIGRSDLEVTWSARSRSVFVHCRSIDDFGFIKVTRVNLGFIGVVWRWLGFCQSHLEATLFSWESLEGGIIFLGEETSFSWESLNVDIIFLGVTQRWAQFRCSPPRGNHGFIRVSRRWHRFHRSHPMVISVSSDSPGVNIDFIRVA